MKQLRVLLIAALSLLLFAGAGLSPRAYAAQTWQAHAGTGIGNGLVATAKFYPSVITIDEGDSITWKVEGDAHTISFLSGSAAPDPLSSTAQMPAGGSTYDGTGFVSSGIVDPGGSYTLTFTKAGTYTYNCLIHPGMTATVVVQPAGTPYPQNQVSYARNYSLQRVQDLSGGLSILGTATTSPVTNSTGNTTYFVSAGTGNGTASIMRFSPQYVILHQGDSITWTNNDPIMPHTVSFPGSDGNIPESFTPAGGSTYDGTVFTSSGIMMPHTTYTLQFTKTGRYNYICILHDELGMKGTIIVLP